MSFCHSSQSHSLCGLIDRGGNVLCLASSAMRRDDFADKVARGTIVITYTHHMNTLGSSTLQYSPDDMADTQDELTWDELGFLVVEYIQLLE